MNKKRITIRLNSNLDMKMEELARKLNTNVSTLIRAFLKKNIDELTDENGNWILPEKEGKRKQG